MGQPKAGTAAAAPSVRTATPADLAAINRVIALARDSWDLPDRVRRLAGRLHELGPGSFDAYEVIVAEDADGTVRGVAVMLPRPPVLDDGAPGRTALYLEGLFVEPEQGRRGIGSLLLARVEAWALAAGLTRIDLRARREAIGFFRKCGYRPLGPDDARHAMTKALSV